MMYRKNVLRPGMTAIAAVLALSSTPSLAQDAATATDAPPTPVATPEPAAEPAPAPEPVAAETVTPAPEPSAAPAAESAPQRSAPAAAAPVRRAAAPARRAAPSAAVAAPASAPAGAVDTAMEAPAPLAAPMESAVPPPIPVQQVATPAAEASAGDDILPIAGAAGVGALALVGGAFALNRRRRHRDEVAYEPETVDSDHVASVEHEPAPVIPLAARAAPAMAAVPAAVGASRYGRHTEAAYRGPTPDNPSLSLKRRLKRAAFFDGRERMAAENGAPAIEPAEMATDASAVTAKVEPAARPAAPAFAPKRSVRPKTQPLFGFQQPAFQN
jgi:hypothetical protein